MACMHSSIDGFDSVFVKQYVYNTTSGDYFFMQCVSQSVCLSMPYSITNVAPDF